MSLETLLDTLRELGWSVGSHNDYPTEAGRRRVYWMFTHAKERRYVDGDGTNDEEALMQCLRSARAAIRDS